MAETAEDETRGGGIMLAEAGAGVPFAALGGVTRAPAGGGSVVAGVCICKVRGAVAVRWGRDLSLIAVLAVQEPAEDAWKIRWCFDYLWTRTSVCGDDVDMQHA